MHYEVKQHLVGGKTVLYKCGQCAMDLESPLEEAGTQQRCPYCNQSLISPGIKELEQDRRNQQIQEQHEAQLRAEREEKEQHEREQKEYQKRLQQQLQKQQQQQPPPQPELVWYGQMYCHSCGYTWQARRQTPPARCPRCSRRNVEPIRQPRRAMGCLIFI